MKKHNTMKVVLLVVTALWLLSALFLPDKSWAVLVKCGLSLVELFLLLFSIKEKNNALKIVLVTTFVFAILTWIMPAAYFSGEYMDQGRIQMGLFDLFNYSLTALSYFGYIALFIVLVGGFYGILYKIPAYRSFLDKIVAVFKGGEFLALSLIMILLAIITSICGIQMVLILFFPLLASIILLMGYDKIVVALTLVGSTMIGVAGSTYAYGNTGLLNQLLGFDMFKEVPINGVILIVGIVLLIVNTLLYVKSKGLISTLKVAKTVVKSEEKEVAKKIDVVDVKASKPATKKTTGAKATTTKKAASAKKATSAKKTTGAKKSATTSKGKASSKSSRKDIKAAVKGDDVIIVKESFSDSIEKFVPTMVNSKHKVWPIITGFILLFVVTLFAFTPWSDTFGLDAFTKATSAVLEFKVFGFEIFGKLLGTVTEFGLWTVTDLLFAMVVIILLLSVIYNVKIDDIYDGFVAGVKKAMVPAIIAVLVYTCLVITTYHPYQLAIYKGLLTISDGFNVVPSSIVAILTSLFNQDPAYSFQAVVPYLTSIVTNTSVYSVVAVLFQALYGISMLVVPTGLVLMVTLAYLEISYKEWLKAIWKLLLELFVAILVISAVIMLAGSELFVIIGYSLILLAYIAVTIICLWKIFKKAGRPGWAAVIPFYNMYVLFEISGMNGWLSLLMYVPAANIIVLVLQSLKLAKAFNKGTGYAVGLILLNWFFMLPLGFSSDEYIKPSK